MGMDFKTKGFVIWLSIFLIDRATAQNPTCPAPETILPCICTNQNNDIRIWCTHSDLPQVLKGVQKIGELVRKPIDELIIENNYLPSMPGKIFQNVKILRLMLRHNGLERLSVSWLETQEKNLVEIFIVENDLKNLPAESLLKLQNLQALTIQSDNLKRIPTLANIPRLKYVNIQSRSLNTINENTFVNLPKLEKLYIQGSTNLQSLRENALYNLPNLKNLEITNCGITTIHMRALSLLPALSELSLKNNQIFDATMVGRATRDLPMLSILNLNNNLIDKLGEGAFVEQPTLESLFLSYNKINIIHHGAFHRVPKLRIVELNYNQINRIHPESFLQQSGSGVEELSLIGNKITHISEFRALLDALPRLRFLDMSDNLLQEIPRGALRGHPSLERLHLNKNSIKFIQSEAFVAMPALRELHLSNNTLRDMNEGPFWNLPALKGLDLSFNYFHRLQPKFLYNLPGLRRINFSYNQLKMIDPITFMELPLLEYVNISGNALVSIHPATFRNLANLYELDASSNRLIEFVPGLPRGIEQIYLNNNQITSLPMTPSPDLDLMSLRYLDISNNGIQKIPNGSFKSLNNLRRLYMKRNGLRQIDTATFSDLQKLEILDVSDNQIISVNPKSFSKLPELKQVNLHGNTIEHFDFISIQDNSALSTLDFSKNKLRTITPSIVRRALDVEILNISLNNLNELPHTLNMLPKLKVLDASNNHIKHFDGNAINNIQTLIEFKLPNNKIVELRTGSFTDLKQLETINLDYNQIEIIHPRAIANLPHLISAYLSRNHIIDIPDRAFSNLPNLRIIELQGNRLQFISPNAFENIPLVQYLNLSNNQLTNIDGSGFTHLMSLEVLDLSFNKIVKLTRSSFQYMEWLVELNLDNNHICLITGQPFDTMPRMKVLSLRGNKLASVSEATFTKLRNNIAILDIDGNPLICNCRLMWLKSWLSESSSLGPKCVDGTYVKSMTLLRNDCNNIQDLEENLRSCLTHENEALLPNLATSQVFTSLDKIKDYATQIRNNYHVNKISNNNRPLPEDSEYFYDEYVDYPYNDTIVDGLNNEINLAQNKDKTASGTGNTPTLYAGTKNVTKSTLVPTETPSSGFTFFGMPLPSIDVGKLLNTGRKIDWTENKNHNKYEVKDPPKFETGGFSPILPTTASGFKPISNPMNITQVTVANQNNFKDGFQGSLEQTIAAVSTKPPAKTKQNSTSIQKIKSEIHELEAFLDDDNKTHVTYNKTKNIEQQQGDPNNISKYNLMESNLTITQVTEKEGILITTDTTNDMSLQSWLESSTMSYSPSTAVTSKPPMKKHIVENPPTALSAVLVPNSEELARRNYSLRPATITKVNMPHVEHFGLNNYAPVINREAKTRFSENTNTANTKTRDVEGKDWYYKNYNKSNLEPYIAPGVHTSCSNAIALTDTFILAQLIILLF